MHYTERIHALRVDRNLSQAQVGSVIHAAQRTYSDYENGKLRISVENLILLARYYNVSMDYICGVSDIEGVFPKA